MTILFLRLPQFCYFGIVLLAYRYFFFLHHAASCRSIYSIMAHRYPLRSAGVPAPAPAVPPPRPRQTQTNRQRHFCTVANRISKRWPITRNKKRCRGLERVAGTHTCYQLSTMQILLHLPKFMNWLNEHQKANAHGLIDWPCDPNHLDMQPPNPANAIVPATAIGCVSCLMKDLVSDYWGQVDLAADGTPNPFDAGQQPMMPIHRLAKRWYAPHVAATASALNRQLAIDRRDALQYADDFLKMVLGHMEETIPRT